MHASTAICSLVLVLVLILYCSVISFPLLKQKHRQHAPTIIAPIPLRNLTLKSVFTDSFWNRQQRIDFVHGPRGLSENSVYAIWHEKMVTLLIVCSKGREYRSGFETRVVHGLSCDALIVCWFFFLLLFLLRLLCMLSHF